MPPDERSSDDDHASELQTTSASELLPEFASDESSESEDECSKFQELEEGWSITPIDQNWVELRHGLSERCYRVAKYQASKARKALTDEACFFWTMFSDFG